jgi:putative transposase
MTPRDGRAPRGERVVDYVPRGSGEQTSLLGAPSDGRGLIAVMTPTGAVDALAFDAYLARVLARRPRRGDVVVLDNLGVHKASRVGQVAEARARHTRRGTSPRSEFISPTGSEAVQPVALQRLI